MSVPDGRIEEKVGKLVAREMLLGRHSLGEDQAIRSNAALLRFLAKTLAPAFARRQKPQHASGNFLEEPHPDVEDIGEYFSAVVEGAED